MDGFDESRQSDADHENLFRRQAQKMRLRRSKSENRRVMREGGRRNDRGGSL